jgi:hypothetical protein
MGIEDEGRAFGFARSSSQVRWDRLHDQQLYAAVRQPLGSLGVGLTLSRLMMRAFGGDLSLSNNGGIVGNGCTAMLLIYYDEQPRIRIIFPFTQMKEERGGGGHPNPFFCGTLLMRHDRSMTVSQLN